jgi:hypothetical protein
MNLNPKYKLILFLIWIFPLFGQNIYQKTIKKNEVLTIPVDERFYWIFEFPYDFQYKIFKESNYGNFEGKNLGIEKLFIRTSVIENRKKVSLQEWQKNFFICKYPLMDLIPNSLEIQNQLLTNYKFCIKENLYQFKTYIFYDNKFYILYIFFQSENKEELKNLIDFINKIQYKIVG